MKISKIGSTQLEMTGEDEKRDFLFEKKKACAIILNLTFYFSICSSPIQDAPLIIWAKEIKHKLPVLYISNHGTKLLLEELQNLESLERIHQTSSTNVRMSGNVSKQLLRVSTPSKESRTMMVSLWPSLSLHPEQQICCCL